MTLKRSGGQPDHANASTSSPLSSDAESHIRLRAIMDASPLPIVTVDLDGNVTSWNRAAERTFGWTESEVLGRRSPTIQEDQRAASDETLSEVLGGKTIAGLERHRVRKDGSPIDLSIFTSPLRDDAGTVVGSIILAEDITEQVRARSELARLLESEQLARRLAEQAENRMSFLTEASAILSSSLDFEATLATVARLAVPAIGDWCSVQIVGEDGMVRTLATQHVDPEKVKMAEDLGREYPFDPDAPGGAALAIRTGRPELLAEISDELIENATDDERLLQILRDLGLRSSMVAPMNARGRTIGAITFVSAESGRSYNEDDLALAMELADRAALAVDNARLYRTAQLAVVQKDEFLSAAAHDLKNPLATVKTLAQTLRRRIVRTEMLDVQRLAEGLDRIDVTATRMASLINELLDATRAQMGYSLELERQSTDLVALLNRVVRDQQDTTERHQLQITCSLPALVAECDPQRVERMIANLVGNAVKFSPLGGPVSITLACEGEGDERAATISIGDGGMGIPTAELTRIFDRFYRASNATGQVPGTGIGLSGAQRIAEEHGGSITVQSEEGRGSTFTVRLPLAAGPPEAAPGGRNNGSTEAT